MKHINILLNISEGEEEWKLQVRPTCGRRAEAASVSVLHMCTCVHLHAVTTNKRERNCVPSYSAWTMRYHRMLSNHLWSKQRNYCVENREFKPRRVDVKGHTVRYNG